MHRPLPNRCATDTSDDAAEAQYRLGEELAGRAFGPRSPARGRLRARCEIVIPSSRVASFYASATISRADVFVKSAEDTVLRKLHWFRLGGEASDRQWSDVCGIVGVQAGNLDVPYLAHWAERLGIRDLLDRLMGDA